ncbi:deoxyribose-phosphate aldolase [Erysipelothrix urinaevulpis]|uniref:deoxyribose-phosphate aldolase n=1 Tax=Erysipelothrix urinaevulpis TaxID=2683717 RepID=UPI00135CCFF4|nr:deoxyribose-phosphate aldolase [Erysipelothrix urinaevulpis]
MKINKLIDHTLLKQDARLEQIQELCKEAITYDFMSVCINPGFVKAAADALKGSGVLVCTVIGFPLGANTESVKVFEAQQAIADGADELDMVINVSDLKDGRYETILHEIKALKQVAGEKTLKVIIETCLLTDDEIVKACELSKEAGADFVKTSTGFSSGGATPEDVALMRQTVGLDMGVKASGGVRSLADLQTMVDRGATRIGASSGVAIMEGLSSKEDY